MPASAPQWKPLPLVYKELKLACGYRLDFLVGGSEAVMLTCLRLSGVRLGLLINFHVPVLRDEFDGLCGIIRCRINAEAQRARRNADNV
jgi:hypothetical protein